MAYDYGLVGGIGQGLQQGLLTYMKVKQLNRENQIQNLTAGVETDEDGNLRFTPQEQAKRQAMLQQTQNQGLLQQGELTAQHHQQDEWTKNAPVEEAERKRKVDSLDASSDASKAYYQGLVSPGKVQAGLSEAQYKEQQPLYIADLNSKRMASALRARQDNFERGQDNKENQDWEKLATTVNNPSSRSALGRYQLNVDKANTLNVLANQIGMPTGQNAPANETPEQRIARFNKADARQLYEFAKAADQLTSNANNTVYGTDHLMPKDMDIASAKIKEYLPIWAGGGKPADAHAGEFIQRYLDSAQREGSYFKSQRDDAIDSIAGGGFEHLKNKNQTRYEKIMHGMTRDQGLIGNTSQVPAGGPAQNQGGLISNSGGSLNGQDPQIAKFATENGLDYQSAANLIATRKAKQSSSARSTAGTGGFLSNFLHGKIGGG